MKAGVFAHFCITGMGITMVGPTVLGPARKGKRVATGYRQW